MTQKKPQSKPKTIWIPCPLNCGAEFLTIAALEVHGHVCPKLNK